MEIQDILGPAWEVIGADQLGAPVHWEETGQTFRANALIKAESLRAHTGEGVLADDSGLQVDILEGAPGVYSARYAGAAASDANNLKKLLRVLEGVPLNERKARFVCVLCYIDREGKIHYFEGTCEGHIISEAVGAGGFGYDPIFVPEGYQQSFAEIAALEKNRISHRSRALAQFLKHVAY